MRKAILVLQDGSTFAGCSFGADGITRGEVVFNTSITGYQEILTDPSYCDQIVVLTVPHIGNYGIHPDDSESLHSRVQAAGLIVKDYCATPSNWRSEQSLGDYLRQQGIVAAEGLPTREIVRHIREQGAMPGILAVGEQARRSVSEDIVRGSDASNATQGALLSVAHDLVRLKKEAAALESMAGKELVSKVTCKKSYKIPPFVRGGKGGVERRFHVIAYDFGIKQNIIRELVKRDCEVTVVPALTPVKEVMATKPDGIVLSNGPGDPAACSEIIENFRPLLGSVPILGICLGHQLLALALGAKTYKLKFGHRGGNQPVKDLESGRVLITSQNHGFAVVAESFPNSARVTQLNLNDQSVEAFRHCDWPLLSIQYHPEASPGPHDANGIFDEFLRMMKNA